MTVVYLPSLGEITGVYQNGRLKQEQLTKVRDYVYSVRKSVSVCNAGIQGIDTCVEGCLRIHGRIRDFLTEQFEESAEKNHKL